MKKVRFICSLILLGSAFTFAVSTQAALNTGSGTNTDPNHRHTHPGALYTHSHTSHYESHTTNSGTGAVTNK